MALLSRQLSHLAALAALLILITSAGILHAHPVPLNSDIAILFDPDSKLTIKEVSSERFQFRFEPWQKESFSFRQQKGSAWLRIPLSPSQPKPKETDLLSVQALSTVNLNVYKVYGNRIEPVTVHYNSHLNNHLFNLSGSEQAGFLYINTDARSIRTLYLNVGPAGHLLKHLESLNSHSGWLFALFATIAGINLIAWLKTRHQQTLMMALSSTTIISIMLLWHGYVQWPFSTSDAVPRTPLSILLLIATLLLVSGIRHSYESRTRLLNGYFTSIVSILILTGASILQGVALSSEVLLTLILGIGISCCLTYLISRSRHPVGANTLVAAIMAIAQLVALLSISGAVSLNFIETTLVLAHCLAISMIILTCEPLLRHPFPRHPFRRHYDTAHNVGKLSAGSTMTKPARSIDFTVFDAMGHELRTPLNGVLGLSELLQTTQLSQKQSEYLYTLQSSGNDLNNLVNLLSNAWQENSPTEMTLYNPQELISNSLSKFSHQAEQSQAEIISSIDSSVPHYSEGSPAMVSLLLESILTHAFQHLEQGDIVLNVTTAGNKHQQIIFEIHLDHSHKVLSSFDQKMSYKAYRNSMGMELSLFLALQQTALGSSNIPELSDDLKRFRFAVDHSAQSHFGNKADDDRLFYSCHSLKVLIVDDNLTCRRVLAEQCSLLGLNCIEAGSGHEALAIIRNEHHLKRQFDGIILDQDMPGMKGIQLLERVAEELPEAETPSVIMLSGTSNPPDYAQAQKLGIQVILTKPVTRFTLKKALSQTIDRTKQPACKIRPQIKTTEPA
ncbi:response regulator [Endozoicomonas lisbonensis]